MKSLNILITAVGGDIGTNIVHILNNQNNINFKIIGTDINTNIFIEDKINKFYKVSKVSNKKYKNEIIDIVTTHDIDILIPVSENEIIWFNNNLKEFGNFQTKILINNSNIINTFLNKYQTSIELNKININTPKTYLLKEFTNQLPLPLIVKSTYSINSKDLYIIKSNEQLKYLNIILKNKENYIIQEYIGDISQEYTTTVYRYNNHIESISFKRKLSAGMTSYAEIVNEEILKKYAINIAIKFNLNGSINIQSRKVDNQFYIFEINPRFSSTIFIRDHFNFKDLMWWINNSIDNNFKIDTNISKTGKAILGYKYKFFD